MSTGLVTYTTAGELAAVYETEVARILELKDQIFKAVDRLNDAYHKIGDARFAIGVTINGSHDVARACKREAWRVLVHKTGVLHVMADDKRRDLEMMLSQHDHDNYRGRGCKDPLDDLPEVTVDNIFSTIQGFATSASTFLDDNIQKVFDRLKPGCYDKKKTNVKNRWALSTKVILSYAVESKRKYGGTGFWTRHQGMRVAIDLEKIFRILDGKGLRDAASDIDQAVGDSRSGEGQTEYFEFKACHNGNLHLTMRRADLVAEFNARAGGSRALPGDDKDSFHGASVYQAPSIEPGVRGFDLFPTPPDLAADVLVYADLSPGMRVLEPNGGTGNLVRAIQEQGCDVVAFEVQKHLAAELQCVCQDFLTVEPRMWEPFDRVIMNPPFSRSQDIHHVRHAWEFLKPGGVLVSLLGTPSQTCQDNAHDRWRQWAQSIEAEFYEIPAGRFAESGTDVACVLMVATKK